MKPSDTAEESFKSSKPAPTLEFNIKDWVSCTVTKAAPDSQVGLDFEYNAEDGHVYVAKVYDLAKMFSDARAGDKLYKFQGRDASEYESLGPTGSIDELTRIMKNENSVSFETLHHDHLHESITEVAMDVELGDIVPLQNYDKNPDLNGQDVEVLRPMGTPISVPGVVVPSGGAPVVDFNL